MYELYADGACQPNPGVGGWAYLLKNTEQPNWQFIESGCVPDSTNNAMELTSILKGLQHFNIHIKGDMLTIITDSKYCLDGMKTWTFTWQENNWRKKDGKTVINVGLWKLIRNELDKISQIKFIHVKGHSGHVENTICDKIAVQEIKKYNEQS